MIHKIKEHVLGPLTTKMGREYNILFSVNGDKEPKEGDIIRVVASVAWTGIEEPFPEELQEAEAFVAKALSTFGDITSMSKIETNDADSIQSVRSTARQHLENFEHEKTVN